MQAVGKVLESQANSAEIQVLSECVELGSILKFGSFYGIVSDMRYREDDKIGGRHKLTASVDVFGEKTDAGFRRLKKPLEPYTGGVVPEASELEGLLSCMDEISVGKVHGTRARALINGGEYDRHIAVLASTGAGKSFLTANLIREYAKKGLPILIVDTHGEYMNLLSCLETPEPLNINVLTVGRKRKGVDQFTIPVSNLTCTDFSHFTSLNDNQFHALDMVLNKVYDRARGKNYSLKDIVETCDEIADHAANNGVKVHVETANALGRRLKALSRVFKEVFTIDGTDLNRIVEPYQITIIDTSLSTQAVRRSVVSYISKKLLEGRISKKHSLEGDKIDNEVLFVIEEAHNYAAASVSHSCRHQLQRIAGEGRKFGVGLLVVSQKPSKIDEEILSQCNTGIYMHITNPKDKEHIKRSFEAVNEEIVRDLDSLDVGECIIAGAMVKLPFLLVSIDKINVADRKESKLQFKKPEKVEQAGFEYV